MPPRQKPARRVSSRPQARKSGVLQREFEHLLERAEKYLAAQRRPCAHAHHGRKSHNGSVGIRPEWKKTGSGAWTRTRILGSKGPCATNCTTPEWCKKCSRVSTVFPRANCSAQIAAPAFAADASFCYAFEESFFNTERCPSGLRSTLGKRVLGKLNRGFESHPLRHATSSGAAHCKPARIACQVGHSGRKQTHICVSRVQFEFSTIFTPAPGANQTWGPPAFAS